LLFSAPKRNHVHRGYWTAKRGVLTSEWYDGVCLHCDLEQIDQAFPNGSMACTWSINCFESFQQRRPASAISL